MKSRDAIYISTIQQESKQTIAIKKMMEDLMNQCKCFIVMLLIGFLSASNPTVISSLSRPINDETFLTPPLTEDNFTSVFPIVCTLDGCIEGRATPGFQIDEYESFFGIPYAEPPIGRLRFAVSNQIYFDLLSFSIKFTGFRSNYDL